MKYLHVLTSDGLHPSSDGLQPTMASTLLAIASTLLVMASTLAMALTIVAMACTLGTFGRIRQAQLAEVSKEVCSPSDVMLRCLERAIRHVGVVRAMPLFLRAEPKASRTQRQQQKATALTAVSRAFEKKDLHTSHFSDFVFMYLRICLPVCSNWQFAAPCAFGCIRHK